MHVHLGQYKDDGERDIQIVLHHYDTWSMDHTLALIIVPLLKQLKATKHGIPNIDFEDMPPHLKYIERHYSPNYDLFPEHDLWEAEFERQQECWDWILDEMIWTFEQIVLDDDTKEFYDHSEVGENDSLEESVRKLKVDREGLKRHHDRIDNGTRLFGKYYQSLWD